MAIGDIIVGIDIGTSKVCTVVGEVNNFGQIETICSTSAKCSGLKKGKIISEEEISLSIAKTIKRPLSVTLPAYFSIFPFTPRSLTARVKKSNITIPL